MSDKTRQTGDLVSDNNIFVDIVNDRVGIGTTTPDALLTVNGVGAHGLGSASAPSFAFIGDLNTGIYSPGADQVAIATNGIGRLFVNHAGQVSVNSILPSVTLRDQSTNDDLVILYASSFGTGANLIAGSVGGTAIPLVFSTDSNERMRIAPDGNVGIGTTNPIGKLSVNGLITASNGSNNNSNSINDLNANFSTWIRIGDAYSNQTFTNGLGIKYHDGNTVHFSTGVLSGKFYISNTSSNGNELFPTTRTDILVANPDGNVGIGTTTPDALLTVNGVGAFGAGSASAPSIAFIGDLDTGIYSPGANEVAIATNGTGRVFVNSAGQVTVKSSSAAVELRDQSTNDLLAGIAGSYFGNSADVYAGRVNGTAIPLVFSTDLNEKMRIAPDGNVGIGTTNPTDKLHIYGGRLELDNALAGQTAIQFNQAGSEMAVLYRPGGVSNTIIMYVAGGGDVMSWTSSGNVGVGTNNPGYKLEVNGSFAATTKSFVIPHPTKPDHKLRYGSLEGPENGVYARGRSKEFIIELPEYWTKLVDPDSITVSLTPIGKSQTLWVKDIKNNKVYVGSKCSEINYFYTIFAERIDVEKLEVEFPVG